MKYDYLIVGAGFAGCVLAERLATQLDKKILLIDRRPHIGGNAYDATNEHGIRIHHYGPHLFHTNDEGVFRYLSQFTAWHPYQHRVMAYVRGKLVPMPINRTTVNETLGMHFATDDEVQSFYEQERERIADIKNSEDVVVSKVGRRLYNLLYKGYTTKHWGVDPSHLASSVCARLPVRTNTDDRYFEDRFQMMPQHGYTSMFEKMISHPNISTEVSIDFKDIPSGTFDRLIFTGPIDEYFGCTHGKLPYRSLRFEFETHQKEFYQPVAQVNYPNDFDYTRITEFKHITGQAHKRTTIAKEFSLDSGDPFYPIPNVENALLYRKYTDEAEKLTSVYFVGRLATYRYYNMDQVTAQALKMFEEIAKGK
ncbi:MAG: UDP-galactopyranose mutase [Ignavibacteriales bacterium]|nr:UDP-galactopyranose mutase [Ignavibacteriales bacterium]